MYECSKDPKVWSVKVANGTEKTVVMQLMVKWAELAKTSTPINITAGMSVCLSSCLSVRTHTRTHTHTHAYIFIAGYLYTHTHTHKHTHTHTHAQQVYIYIYSRQGLLPPSTSLQVNPHRLLLLVYEALSY
jgi:hypothetical protein